MFGYFCGAALFWITFVAFNWTASKIWRWRRRRWRNKLLTGRPPIKYFGPDDWEPDAGVRV